METAIIIFVVALILMPFAIRADREIKAKTQQKPSRYQALKNLPDFTATDYHLSESSEMIMAFDDVRKKICFLDRSCRSFIYDYNKILECELVIDGETISKHSTGSAVGRAVLGAILAGGVGAIIGGVTGSSKKKETVNSMDLKVIIDDSANPIFKINFFTGLMKKESTEYKIEHTEIERWHAIISGLISHGSKDVPAVAIGNGSVADELKKLKDLLDSGAITGVEYEKQKQKMLA